MAPRARKRSGSGTIGRPKVFAKRQLVSLRVAPALHDALIAYARKDGRPLNVILLRVIEGWWSELPEGKGYKPAT
jgi:hypothetical protein